MVSADVDDWVQRQAYDTAEAVAGLLWDRWPQLVVVTGANAAAYPLVAWLDGPCRDTVAALVEEHLPVDQQGPKVLRRRLSPHALCTYVAATDQPEEEISEVTAALREQDLPVEPTLEASVLLAAVGDLPTLEDDYLVVGERRLQLGYDHIRTRLTPQLAHAALASLR